MKTCSKCSSDKPLVEFVKDKRRSDGAGSWCISCNRLYMNVRRNRPDVKKAIKSAYQENKVEINEKNKARWHKNKDRYKVVARAWDAGHRDKMLEYYRDRGAAHRSLTDSLKDFPCLDCGKSYPPYCMEFDHVRGEKRFAIGKMSNHTMEAVLEELAKCELVCCSCHRIRTDKRRVASTLLKVQEFHNWLASYKAMPCLDCRVSYPSVAMDFDHVVGEKLSEIAKMWSWGRNKVLAEIQKCELVCANCHRIRTQNRRNVKVAA